VSRLDLCAVRVWPGVRRAGLPGLSPALTPGPRRRRRRLDPFTLAVLKAHAEKLNQERRELGPDYHDHGVLFCWEDGRPPHPDTITRRFKQLAAAAGLPEIDLHDVRHSYATAGQMSRIAFDASFGRLREHALPAAQRATLRPPGPPECRPATVTWGFMVCLDLMQR
jgi:integrase